MLDDGVSSQFVKAEREREREQDRQGESPTKPIQHGATMELVDRPILTKDYKAGTYPQLPPKWWLTADGEQNLWYWIGNQ